MRDLSISPTGNLILYLPFDGDAVDKSGNNLDVTVSGAILTSDHMDKSQKAYYFDGVNDYKVENSEFLNFSNAITLNFWLRISVFYDREQYPISHGNWENRWKISVSDNKLRWTINTSAGITDLDAETPLEKNQWYNITAYYSGEDLELYINGKLDAFKYWNGSIKPSPVDLTIGQVLPNSNQYNLNGKVDDIRLYDYPLTPQEISDIYEIATGLEENNQSEIPDNTVLHQNYPNPFNPSTTIQYGLRETSDVSLKVFNMLGQNIATLVDGKQTAGSYSVLFDASGLASGIYFYQLTADNTTFSKRMILMK